MKLRIPIFFLTLSILITVLCMFSLITSERIACQTSESESPSPETSTSGTPTPTPTQGTPTPTPTQGTPTPTPTSGSLADSDGDGLPDKWEIYGVDVVVDSKKYFIDLKAMGANPQHKDLFLQIDYMVDKSENDSHSHKPKDKALEKVIKVFADAPVPNPDKKNGITVHIDAGSDTIMDPVSNKKWEKLSESHALEHVDNLGSGNRRTGYVWDEFNKLEEKNFSRYRRKVFRYCIFAHNLGVDLGKTSGWSRNIPGTAFVVSLGSWTDGVGSVNEQAGTLLHEWGHTIGLRHGGGDNINYKPNFLSIMNYDFQTRGLRLDKKNGKLSYSWTALPTLNEESLNKTLGLYGGDTIKGYGTIYRTYDSDDDTNYWWYVDNANGPIDWNRSGSTTETSVKADINGDGKYTKLEGYNDWKNLKYSDGSLIGKTEETIRESPAETVDEELTYEEDQKIVDQYEVSVSFDGNKKGRAGGTVAYIVTVKNNGTDPDTYTLKAESEKGWADLSALPATVQIGAGQTVQYTINVKIPSSVSAEGTDTLYFEATSTNSPDMIDSSEVTTELISDTSYDQSGQARAVSSSNQGCFIATAAYGSPLDPHVVSLRRFRDAVLLKSLAGSLFVRAYYYCSPPLAEYIAHRPMLRAITALLLTPLVWGVEYPLPASVMMVIFIIVLRRLLRLRRRGAVSQ